MPIRKHIFKAKRKDNKEWVKGYYAECDGRAFIMPIPDCDTSKYMLTGFWLGAFYEVGPETVCEYTGVPDKNGNKIFEGDILKGFQYPFLDDKGNHNYYAKICWFDNSPAFGIVTVKNPKSEVRGISEGNVDYLENFESEMWEVIGNIYDNPELLEVGSMSDWISVKDKLPECEEEVLVLAKSLRGYKTVTTAMYEDGTMAEDDSAWGWEDIDFDYDEGKDSYIIPCGWWEYRHYGESLNYAIDDEVTHWQPLPEPPKDDA